MKHTKVTYTCDLCKARTDNAVVLNVVVGKDMDPSGNGYVPDIKELDVCRRCLEELVLQRWRELQAVGLA